MNIETSTKNCSINIAKNGVNIALVEENNKKYLHIEKLHEFIKKALILSNIEIKKLKAICISSGPGSYSAIRIGMSAAKGLCLSLGIPLLSLDSLTIMIQKINIKNNVLIMPLIYAKSNYFYTTLFNKYKEKLQSIYLQKINYEFFKRKLEKNIYFVGNFNPIKNIKSLNNQKFILNYPSAYKMSYLSYKKFLDKQFVDIKNHIPIYL